MYIVNDVTARIFNTDNLQVILISPNDDTEIVGVMVDYEDYTVICKCTSHQTARSVWRGHCAKSAGRSRSFRDLPHLLRRLLTSLHARENEKSGVN